MSTTVNSSGSRRWPLLIILTVFWILQWQRNVSLYQWLCVIDADCVTEALIVSQTCQFIQSDTSLFEWDTQTKTIKVLYSWIIKYIRQPLIATKLNEMYVLENNIDIHFSFSTRYRKWTSYHCLMCKQNWIKQVLRDNIKQLRERKESECHYINQHGIRSALARTKKGNGLYRRKTRVEKE